MKKTIAWLLTALLACLALSPALAAYGSIDPNWTPNQGASPDFIATLAQQTEPQKGYRKIGDVPEYRLEQVGPVEAPPMTISEFWASLFSRGYDAMINLQGDPNGLANYNFPKNSLSAIWAGNRIFELYELYGGWYPAYDYDASNDTIYNDNDDVRQSFDDYIHYITVVKRWCTIHQIF